MLLSEPLDSQGTPLSRSELDPLSAEFARQSRMVQERRAHALCFGKALPSQPQRAGLAPLAQVARDEIVERLVDLDRVGAPFVIVLDEAHLGLSPCARLEEPIEEGGDDDGQQRPRIARNERVAEVVIAHAGVAVLAIGDDEEGAA